MFTWMVLFDGLGEPTREVTTRSPLTAAYIEQGLAQLFAFGHQEAERSAPAVGAVLTPSTWGRVGELDCRGRSRRVVR